jgi:hypothetical protein
MMRIMRRDMENTRIPEVCHAARVPSCRRRRFERIDDALDLNFPFAIERCAPRFELFGANFVRSDVFAVDK